MFILINIVQLYFHIWHRRFLISFSSFGFVSCFCTVYWLHHFPPQEMLVIKVFTNFVIRITIIKDKLISIGFNEKYCNDSGYFKISKFLNVVLIDLCLLISQIILLSSVLMCYIWDLLPFSFQTPWVCHFILCTVSREFN